MICIVSYFQGVSRRSNNWYVWCSISHVANLMALFVHLGADSTTLPDTLLVHATVSREKPEAKKMESHNALSKKQGMSNETPHLTNKTEERREDSKEEKEEQEDMQIAEEEKKNETGASKVIETETEAIEVPEEEPPTKRFKSTNGEERERVISSYKYWQVTVKEPNDLSYILTHLKNCDDVVETVFLAKNTMGIYLKKNMEYQCVSGMFEPNKCFRLAPLTCSQFNQAKNEDINKNPETGQHSSSHTHSKMSSPLTSTYYSFVVSGNDFSERLQKTREALKISPIKRIALVNESRRCLRRSNLPRGAITDIYFLSEDMKGGCFVVRGKKMDTPTKSKDEIKNGLQTTTETDIGTETSAEMSNENEKENIEMDIGKKPTTEMSESGNEAYSLHQADSFDIKKYYEGLLCGIDKISKEKYRQLTRVRNQRPQSKSWICVDPFYERGGEPSSEEELKAAGVSGYRILKDGIGVFQFMSDSVVVKSEMAVKAMGAMHKSLCFRTTASHALHLVEEKGVVHSMGDVISRARRRNIPKRRTRYIKFCCDGKELSVADVLEVGNKDGPFSNVLVNSNMGYGLGQARECIEASQIKIRDLCFTPMTKDEFQQQRKLRSLWTLKTRRNHQEINTLSDIKSRMFMFKNMPQKSVDEMQRKATILIANKIDEGGYHGVIQTKRSIGANKLSPGGTGTIFPLEKDQFEKEIKRLHHQQFINAAPITVNRT
nr:MAG: wsv277-like protein [Metapenaeus ensis nimavirus]